MAIDGRVDGRSAREVPGNERPTRRGTARAVGCVLVLLTLHAASARLRGENPVFDSLMRRGVTVGPQEAVRLPAPTMADGLTAEGQRRAVESIAGSSHTWEDLTRKSVVAPFILRMPQEKGQQAPHGRRLDVWFVAYGDIKTIDNQDFLQKQYRSATSETDPENGATTKLLTPAELTRRGIASPQQGAAAEEVAVEFTLLDRVRLQVSVESTRSRTDESSIAATILDRRFMKDAEFPNQWRPVTRDDAGRRQFGDPQPYYGFGGYAKTTRLIDPPGALFVEYHAAFAEPPEWFGGTNLLRSKLPILAQLIVRQLRRGLQK